MQFVIGLVSNRVPAHLCGVHAGEVFVFAIAAEAAFTYAIVQFAAFIFNLINSKTLTDVSAIDDETFSHV